MVSLEIRVRVWRQFSYCYKSKHFSFAEKKYFNVILLLLFMAYGT